MGLPRRAGRAEESDVETQPGCVSLLRCRPESALRLFGKALKRCRIFHREVGENFAVELDARLLQAIDELAVADAVQFGGGSDAHNPQRTILTLALLTSGVGELQPAIDRLFGGAVQFGFCKKIAASAVQYLFALGT